MTLMDINAGTTPGEETIEDVGWKLLHFTFSMSPAAGKDFLSDQWGLHNQLGDI
ncbi:hypothetical protein KCP69_06355 [Salmonella enterica subsp. enterica]|nr:hypothetical protein KCP69_06355 [Salmonella enterica subsp. enterica]